jgi:hypothetical protein
MRSLVTAIACAVLLSACGMSAPRSGAGYVDFETVGWRSANTSLKLSLGPTLLGWLAHSVEDDDTTRAVLNSLDGVRVQVLELKEHDERIPVDLARMSNQLQQGWQAVVRVRDTEELAHVLVLSDGEVVSGLTVLSYDGEEVVLMNMVGTIQFDSPGEVPTIAMNSVAH